VIDERGLPRAPHEGEAAGLAYGEWPGERDQWPIVGVHGIASNHRAFLDLAPQLAPHRVVAHDLRGRGRSRRDEPFGVAQHAADLLALCDALELDQPLVVGHSLGAYVAVEAAAAAPGRFAAIVMLDGGVWPPWQVPQEMIDFLLAPSIGRLELTFASLDEYVAYWESSVLRLPDTPQRRSQLARDLRTDGEGYRPATDTAVFRRDSLDLLRHPQRNRLLAKVDVPLLLVRAGLGMTGDPSSSLVPDVSVGDARRHDPGLPVLDLPGVNHYELLDQPAAASVATAVRRLVDELAAG
jgi:pimeloyl-ACP methyl ester carboxylesterase